MNANGLLIQPTGVLAAMLVGEVHRVARELNTARLFAFAEVGVVLACCSPSLAIYIYQIICSLSRESLEEAWTYGRSPRGGLS